MGNLRINHKNLPDLRFADWQTKEICGIAIAE
jgi:hypothetical protein